MSAFYPLLSGDPSFPLLNRVQTLMNCQICFYPHHFLPNIHDFSNDPYPGSTRISEISVFDGRFWKFTNYLNHEYFRLIGYTSQWLYIKENCLQRFCGTANQHLEQIYGYVLQQAQSSCEDWILKGYVQRKSETDWRIWFCERKYMASTDVRPPPGFHPESRTDSGVCENCFKLGSTCPPARLPSTSEVFTELVARFRERYERRRSWLSKFPVRQNQLEYMLYPMYALFDLSIKFCDGRISERLLWPLDVPNKMILVQAPPGFGKSTLLNILSLHWLHSFSELENFQLCILLDLSKRGFNLEESRDFVTACIQELKNTEYTFDMVEKALTENSDKVLLLLDGYDMLPEDSQQKVLNFIQSSDCVRNSTVLIATRPTNNTCFLQMFGKHVTMGGFSSDYLRRYARKSNQPVNSVNAFSGFFGERLNYLSELSPYFTSFVWRIIEEKAFEYGNNPRLYRFVKLLLLHVVKDKLSPSQPKEHVGTLLHKLGELLFRALVKDKRVFTLDLLKELFLDDLKFLVECNFFIRQSKDSSLWVVPSKILAVFFATLYLKGEWRKLETEEQRRSFFENVFCCGACAGDYVQGKDSLYCVGLIPEIVLELKKRDLLETAAFRMFCDVECIEDSSAFDSINLLSRINEKFLGRYGFRTVPQNDKRVLSTFGFIFDLTPLENFNVDYFFYSNCFEKKGYSVVDIKSNDDTVLRAILSAKNVAVMDRIHIDFVYHEFDGMFDFVRGLLTRYLRGFDLLDEVRDMPPMHFVFNLFCLMCDVISKRTATIVCETIHSRELLAKLKVCWNSEARENTVCVFGQGFECKEYKKDTFFSVDPATSIPNFDEENTSDFRISINLF